MTDLERIIAEMRQPENSGQFGPWEITAANIKDWADRLAALAGAAPVGQVITGGGVILSQKLPDLTYLYAQPYGADAAELADWRELFVAVCEQGLDTLDTSFKPTPLWPNNWHQDVAVVAELLHEAHAPAKADEERDMAVLDKYAEVARALGFDGDAWFGDPLASHDEVVARAKAAKAREVTEADVERACRIAYEHGNDDTTWNEAIENKLVSDAIAAFRAAMRAALATFAEGE